MKTKILIISIILIFATLGCTNKKYVYQGETQGSTFNIIFYAPQNKNFVKKVNKIIDSTLLHIDTVASVFNDKSEISTFNANDTLNNPSEDFINLLQKSKEMYYLTKGAFNPAIGPLVKYYGFLKDKGSNNIDTNHIKELLTLTFLDSIKYDKDKNIITKPKGYYLDFNAIATGYTVDKLAKIFDSLKIENYLIEIGGEVYAKGNHKNGQPWTVGIEKPPVSMYSPQEVLTKVLIKDMAIVTSGVTRKYHNSENKRVNHIINPQTGFSIPSNILSVSVIATSCTQADALATAFMIMGLDSTLSFIEKVKDCEVYFIISERDTFNIKYSKGFQKYILN
jgi:thiamine biosynthesis lipoprotein